MPYKDPQKRKEKDRIWRENNPDYFKKWRLKNPNYDTEYKKTHEVKKYKRSPQATNRAIRKWRLAHPDRNKAHRLVFVGIRNGSIKRHPCEICGLEKSEAHHEDYSKPLEVTWLCRPHHREADAKRKGK